MCSMTNSKVSDEAEENIEASDEEVILKESTEAAQLWNS